MGDVTGLQGLTDAWIEDRQGCLILGELFEKEKQFFVYLEDHLPLPWKQLEGGVVVMGLALGEVPGQELQAGPKASVPLGSFWTPLIPARPSWGRTHWVWSSSALRVCSPSEPLVLPPPSCFLCSRGPWVPRHQAAVCLGPARELWGSYPGFSWSVVCV